MRKNNMRMYDANSMMNAAEIRDVIAEEIKREVVKFVMNEDSGLSHLFNHSTWHDDEGRSANYGGKLGQCTYEKAIEVLINRRVRFFKCTYVAIHITEEQYNNVAIRRVLSDACFAVYVHRNEYYGIAEDFVGRCMDKGHVKTFLNIDLVNAY